MTEEQKQNYVDEIISGGIPDQETFTNEEAFYLVNATASWASSQVTMTLDNTIKKESALEELIAMCEYNEISEALKYVQETIEEEMSGTADFILNHFA